jgi:uncharacterized peroxidase-related enzyme
MKARDAVEEAGLESFPASDAPAWGRAADKDSKAPASESVPMSRLHTLPVTEAGGELAELFGAIKKAVGKVPNVYATLGSNSPALLAQVLRTGAVLQNDSLLSRRELEAINLTVSEASGCDYCVAAHTLVGKAVGYTAEQTRALRRGDYPFDAKINALVHFVRLLLTTTGTLPEEELAAVRQAGYGDRQIVEAIGAVSAILFTNLLNRTNDTTLDFPRAELAA